MSRIRILQIGPGDLQKRFTLHPEVEWTYMQNITVFPEEEYELILVTGQLSYAEYDILQKKAQTYRLYFTEEAVDKRKNVKQEELIKRRMVRIISMEELDPFLAQDVRYFFDYTYGEKFFCTQLCPAQGFRGKVQNHGGYGMQFSGDFGETLRQVAYWRYNIPIYAYQSIDFWLEYETRGEVEIQLHIVQYDMDGSLANVRSEYFFSEEELKNPVVIDNEEKKGALFVSVLAKGEGGVLIRGLHDRHSRRSYGTFLVGGERYVSSMREEVFAYFDPGDFKPPLNVYFSGYKTQEGFEGKHLLEQMGAPMLLISESRLEGGSFYIGSKEYEGMIYQLILDKLKYLGFDSQDLVLSGMSMGTYAAMYYGTMLQPHAIILGKPLASAGDIAKNEKKSRPDGFPTSLDVLLKMCGDLSEESIERLNQKMWKRVEKADWHNTKFAVSYMYEDDYDKTAYEMLLSHLQSDGVTVYGKGLHGRHNDNTAGIAQWFRIQYQDILGNDFKRRRRKNAGAAR